MAFRSFFCVCILLGGVSARDVHFFVSPTGSDSNNGSDARLPLRTITKALSYATKSIYTATDNLFIELMAGYHDLNYTVYVNKHHANLLTIRSYKGQKVHVTGGRRIPTSNFHAVTDGNILNALPQDARRHVKYVNLPKLGITDYGTMKQYGFHAFRSAPLEVFHNGQAFRMAQWPNEGYINIVGTPDGNKGLRVKYNSTRPSTWRHLDDLWVYGFWYRGWADRSAKVASIDTKNMIVTMDNSTSNILGVKTGHWGESGRVSEGGGYFRFINVLSELDQPGEYYLDRKTGNLYVWLTSATPTDIIHVSMIKTCLAFANNVKNVLLSDFIVEICREKAVSALNMHNLQLTNMEVRNTGDFSIYITGDSRDCIISKTIVHDGDGAIFLQGGNRARLESSGNVIEDCDIYRYSRVSIIGKDALKVSGVGNLVRYNNIHDGSTSAIRYYGNDHVIEYNNLHHVCVNVSYCSAVYSDNDLTYRGIKIRNNHIHDVVRFAPGNLVYGLMLNHEVSSAEVTKNVFYNNEVHLLIGGGRDNIVTNNVMYNATKYSMQVDGRGRGRAKTVFANQLRAVPYNGPLWKSRYPELANFDHENITLPEGNQIHKNLLYVAKNDRLIDGMSGWLKDPIYFNLSDIGFSLGQEDHNNVKLGDLRVRCHAAVWANKVNFEQVLSPNDVGPRYDVGPSFSKEAHKTIHLRISPGGCSTHPPASPGPMPAYLPDGSGQTPIYRVFDEGCWLHVEKCTNDPAAAGTYRDMLGERVFHAADNETMCFKRAIEQWKFCGSNKNEYVAAIYGPTGAMTYGGEGCFVSTYGCPKHSGPADGHVVPGVFYRDGYAEKARNASHDQEKCLSRARDIWTYCGSNPNHTVTMVFMANGAHRTAGAGCWIETTTCHENPKISHLFYDAVGATNYYSDDFEYACFERAKDYWTYCGSDKRHPVIAHFRPTTNSFTYPPHS